MTEKNDNEQLINKAARDILMLARSLLIVRLRFLDIAIGRLDLVPADDRTFSTDGTRIIYGPKHVVRSYRYESEKPARDYLHMVLHCIYSHMFIGILEDPELWDLACDIAVESTINDLGLDGVQAVLCSNFLGETLDHAAALGLDGLLFVSHIGKFIKVSGGIMNTHSRCSDSRAELCAACALRAGIPAEGARRILETETTDEAAGIMEEYGVLPQAMKIACEKIRYYLQLRTGGCVPAEAVLFNTVQGELGRTEGAEEMIRRVRSEWPGSGAVSGCGRR